MPVRQLQYLIEDVYPQYIAGKKRYSYTQIKLPTPKFYVLYNGKKRWDVTELRLSDSFIVKEPTPCVEVIAKVINIRYDKSNEVLARSESLSGYSFFNEEVDKGITSGYSRDKAIEHAIRSCMSKGILVDYFSSKKHMEVIEMLNWTYNAEEAREAAIEEGFAEGKARGRAEGKAEGIEQGIERGIKKTAINLLIEKQSYDFIKKITGLSYERIHELEAELSLSLV
jgi:hypothetical protein